MAEVPAHFFLISPGNVTNDGDSEYFLNAQKIGRLGRQHTGGHLELVFLL